MSDFHIFVKYGPGEVVTIVGPNCQIVELSPGSEVHLKFSIYEKEKEK